ncbi:MAG: response regulator transcription factor [Desulfotomaculaceae bacterium]|nr:response regulator transcription factor [Desulfotomaculaceae bacterium]
MLEKPKILIVDAEQKIREVVRLYLENEGFLVGESSDGQAALKMFDREKWDLIVLDLMLPGLDGWAVCREIRKTSSTPIIMLTAQDTERDRILGLELGADDYVVKPFSPRELAARVKAVLRRTRYSPTEEVKQVHINYPDFSINPKSRLVMVNEQQINLKPKEYDLLYHLAKSPNRTFTREELLVAIWGYDYWGGARTVDTHVNRLRNKLLKASGDNFHITTVWGVGYRFDKK